MHQEFDGKADYQEIQKRLDLFLIESDEVAENYVIKEGEERVGEVESDSKIVHCSIHRIISADWPNGVALQ